ncbi:hypothetical protein L1887_58287 [Cichorium endivia]|nr:hypothetical protein L1887_58287 [Cichorium endivia]
MFEAIYIEIDARAPASSAGSTRRAIRGPVVAMAPLAFDGADVDEVEAGEVELELELELELPEVSVHVVDVLYHDRSVGAIGDAHAGNIEARSIGVEAELALARDGDILAQRRHRRAVRRLEERFGASRHVERDIDVDRRRVVVAVNLHRAVSVVPWLARQRDVVEAAAEIVVLLVLVESTRRRVVQGEVRSCGRGECQHNQGQSELHDAECMSRQVCQLPRLRRDRGAPSNSANQTQSGSTGREMSSWQADLKAPGALRVPQVAKCRPLANEAAAGEPAGGKCSEEACLSTRGLVASFGSHLGSCKAPAVRGEPGTRMRRKRLRAPTWLQPVNWRAAQSDVTRGCLSMEAAGLGLTPVRLGPIHE